MGVNGLWQVLQPCARPTNLATLNRQRLAVDASIWIYQFLKAVRDKEGHALRNAHVVGFFRRICKLLWFGILPVFVFDGGAPVLKRTTLQNRRHRREGRRDDAVRTAGKLLAVQMQRLAEEEANKRKEATANKRRDREDEDTAEKDGLADGEVLPSADQLVYADELHMSQQQRQQSRKFTKQDAYHLPDLDHHNYHVQGGDNPDDPRIMSIDELEDYARQFHAGEDINLYDFSKIDFDGEFFRSLPPADRYNILNAARIRSRLRMGLSKEQLDTMFPDRMAFSRFQIERVRERNHLTQRLMIEAGMSGIDLTMGGSRGGGAGMTSRVAGESDREYILVKNDGAEGGWALGVVSRDKDRGEINKPIDVDALQFRYQGDEKVASDNSDSEDDMEFEDVPIEGLNRLPKLRAPSVSLPLGEEAEDDDALFVASYDDPTLRDSVMKDGNEQKEVDALAVAADEDDDLRRAIAMSLQSQHGIEVSMDGQQGDDAAEDLSDAIRENDCSGSNDTDGSESVPPPPQWTQKAAKAPRPIVGAKTGLMVAHVVNNRANAAIAAARSSAKGKEREMLPGDNGDSSDSSDGELDIRAAMAKAAARAERKQRSGRDAVPSRAPPAAPSREPLPPRETNPFDGPLPFEKLDWRSSIFEKKPAAATTAAFAAARNEESAAFEVDDSDGDDHGGDDLAGGFEREPMEPPSALIGGADAATSSQADEKTKKQSRPLPPWMADVTDIRTSVRQQQQYDEQLNAEDREMALAEAQIWQPQSKQQLSDTRVVTVNSSSDDGSDDDVEVLDALPHKSPSTTTLEPLPFREQNIPTNTAIVAAAATTSEPIRTSSPEMELEDVAMPTKSSTEGVALSSAPESKTGMADADRDATLWEDGGALLFRGDGYKENSNDGSDDNDTYDLSDPEDDELLAQMAEEAEEHARFASSLNHKTTGENQAAYEAELKALRNQQKRDRRDADEVTQIMVAECQALLRLFGIPYLTAPMEAEAQCAELVSLGLVDGIVTDDSDTFLFGGTRVYKNMFNGNKFVECYLSTDFVRELSLSRTALIALAQLLGSDYTDGLPGVGPVTAMEILSEFPPGEGTEEEGTQGENGLAAFRAWWEAEQAALAVAAAAGQKPPPPAANAFRRKFRKAHAAKLFLPAGFPSSAVAAAYLQPEVDHSTEPFQWGVPDLDGLRRFLMATIGWSQERTDEVLVPVIRDMNQREAEGTQSNITRFLTGAVGAGARLTPVQAQAQAEALDREKQLQNKRAPPDTFAAPRHAPRNKNTASSRRMAAAVSKLKDAAAGTTIAETVAASVMRAPGDKLTRKRKGRRTATTRTKRRAASVSDEADEAKEADETAETEEAGEDEAVATDEEVRRSTAKRRRETVGE